jgi:hypothetical protein
MQVIGLKLEYASRAGAAFFEGGGGLMCDSCAGSPLLVYQSNNELAGPSLHGAHNHIHFRGRGKGEST